MVIFFSLSRELGSTRLYSSRRFPGTVELYLQVMVLVAGKKLSLTKKHTRRFTRHESDRYVLSVIKSTLLAMMITQTCT